MKIAVVGLGVIGKTHVKALSFLGHDVSLLCDIIPERAEKVKETLAPKAQVYTDFLEMLEKERPDAVHICTPHYLHAGMVIEALKRDIHVLCEKPLCMKKEELPAVLEAERVSSAKLGV
ncbi:MAG: Gfo/Idh/MocA family oxidoreductase, partial [Clostridia bacterium]|nr:Gfo/Idh/MocA family oxidoreductase [Clostridia bacterium]